MSYGTQGGIRAVEQLRLTFSALQVAHVSAQVSLSLLDDFTDWRAFTPGERRSAELTATPDQLISWSAALATTRAARLLTQRQPA